MLTISGRSRADAAALSSGGKYALSWPRAVYRGASTNNNNSNTIGATHVTAVSHSGQRVASSFVARHLASITDAAVSADGSLVAAIGVDGKGRPLLVAGEEGLVAEVRTSHALTRVLVLDGGHIVVADANDVAHLFVVAIADPNDPNANAGPADDDAAAAASSFAPQASSGRRFLRAAHALPIEAIVDWVALTMPIPSTLASPSSSSSSSSSPLSGAATATFVVALVRNSHVMVLRLDTACSNGPAASLTAAPPMAMLRRCASATVIPTPQRLAAFVHPLAATPSSSSAAVSVATLWLASGRECCAVRLTLDGAALHAASSSAGGSACAAAAYIAIEPVEGARVPIPNGAAAREVISVAAVSASLAHVLLRPAPAEGAAHHNASDDEGSAGGAPVDPSAADAVTIALPNAAALSSSVAVDALPITSVRSLCAASGHPIIAGGFSNGRFVGLVSLPRQRAVGLVPLTPSAAVGAGGFGPLHPPLVAYAASSSASSQSQLFQRRMERAKAELSAIAHAAPSTAEASSALLAAALRLQDEGRALQRSVEGAVSDASSAPLALLRQLYVIFTRATVRHLFLQLGASLSAPVDLAASQALFVSRLDALRSVAKETLCGLPNDDAQHIARQRWGPTAPIFSLLQQQLGIAPRHREAGDADAEETEEAGVAKTEEDATSSSSSSSAASSSPSPSASPYYTAAAGAALLEACGEQLTADVAVAALYLIIAQKGGAAVMPSLAAPAVAMLRAAGLSPALLHWALLFYLCDNEADSEDLAATRPHLLTLDRTYDFGCSVMPRIADALVAAGNVDAAYLLMPSLIGTAAAPLSDRLAVRMLLVAMIKGNAGLIAALLALSRAFAAPWRAVALHVAAVACAAMGQSHLLDGAVGSATATGGSRAASGLFAAAASPATHRCPTATVPSSVIGVGAGGAAVGGGRLESAAEEAIVEAALRAVGTRTAHRIFIEFLTMQRRYEDALALCELFPTGSDAEHQSVAALVATLRCLVPQSATSAIARRAASRPYAFSGFLNPDSAAVVAAAEATRSVDSLRVNTDAIDAVAASVAAAAAGQSLGTLPRW